MPSKVYWLDEPQIMVAEYTGEVTRDDINSAMDQCLGVLAQRSCHFVVDTLHIAALPKDIFRIGSLLSLVNHSNRGWLIFVAQHNVMLKFAVQVMVRNKFRFMSSRDEAIAFLRDVVKHAAQSATETTVEPPGV